MGATTGIPRDRSEVTATWVDDVLGTGGRVTGVEVEDLTEGTGLLADVSRVRVAYRDAVELPPTFVLKLPARGEANLQAALAYGFYVREVNFYRNAGDQLDVRIPRCSYAAVAEAGTPFALLLEDLGGARPLDQLGGVSEADDELVVDALAALHAPWWESERLAAATWLPVMDNPLHRAADEHLQGVLPMFHETWGDRVPASALAAADGLVGRWGPLLEWWARDAPQTLCHYDVRGDNLLVDGEGRLCLLDFQLVVRHVAAFDLAYFLAWSHTVEARREREERLLRRYHDALGARGVTGYPLARLQDHYRASGLNLLASAVVSSPFDPGDDRGRALLATMVERVSAFADDHRSAEFLPERA